MIKNKYQHLICFLLFIFCFTNASAESGVTSLDSDASLTRSMRDMQLKIPGGYLDIIRTWKGGNWEWNERWNGPWKLNDLVITRGRTFYVFSRMDGDLMVFQDRAGNKILVEPWHKQNRNTEAVWVNRNGETIRFSDVGRQTKNAAGEVSYIPSHIKSFSYRGSASVNFELDIEGRIQKILSGNNLLLEYTWTQGRLTKITDFKNRKVNYSYSVDGELQTVTDVLGHVWKYTKDTQEDPEGNISKFVTEGLVDKTTENKRFSEVTTALGNVIRREMEYDSKTATTYTTEQHSTGLFIETWSDARGHEVKRQVNGELISLTQYDISKHSKSSNQNELNADYFAGISGETGSGYTNHRLVDSHYCKLTGGFPLWLSFSSGNVGVGSTTSGNYLGCEDKYVNSLHPDDPSYAAEKARIDLMNEKEPFVRHLPKPIQGFTYVKLKTSTNARGGKTVYEYDQWTNEVKVTYPDGTSISRTWHDKYSFPLTETNEKGVVVAYEYDDEGNLLTLTEAKGTPDERKTRYTYDELGQVLTKTTGESAAGNTALATTSYEYDQYGNITQVTDPEGNITKYSDYDALGNAQTITEARANLLPANEQYSWKYTYDAAGNLLTSSNPYGAKDVYTYNKIGAAQTITSPSGSKVTLTTNPNGQPLTMTDDNGFITRINYDKSGKLIGSTDSNGHKSQLIYDQSGRLSRVVDGENNQVQLNYANNLLQSVQYPTYKAVAEYTSVDQIKQINLLANSRTYARKGAYDQNGNLTKFTDALENEINYEYDVLNRVKKTINAKGDITEVSYDARDNLLQVKDPEGRLTIYTYDKNDRLLSETKDGDQNTDRQRRYLFDQNGNLTSSINPEQEKTLYEFDQANRLVKIRVYAHKNHTQPIKTINYHFNEKNHLTGWNQQASTTLPEGVLPTADAIAFSEAYTYNNLEQLESVSVNFGGFTKSYSYTYYTNGLKKTYTNPEGVIYTYFYNKNNQLMAIHIPGEGQISWTNFNWMMPQTLLLPGGQKISLKYDDFQQLKERVLKKADNTELAKAVYEYDLEQNIKKIEKGEGTFNYSYDNLYRLTAADLPSGYAASDENFDYDGVGNRISRTQSNTSESQSYNQKNQLQAIDSSDNNQDVTYTYNANGHTKTQIKNGVTTEYVYNHEERLIAVKRNGSTIGEYAYNAYGQRVKKTVSGMTTWYLYNDTGLAAEYSDTGFLVREYQFHSQKTWMTDPLFVRTATGDIYYYHNDHLGTPQQLLDTAGNIVWNAQYSAFGKAHITINTIENNLRFPGQYYDAETGLHHNYMRDYDSETGRYLQADPLGVASSLNYYAYAYQNPHSYTDPTGEIVPLVAFYARCVLSCIAFGSLESLVFQDPCTTTGDLAAGCAVGCLNPVNWLKIKGPKGKPPKKPKDAKEDTPKDDKKPDDTVETRSDKRAKPGEVYYKTTKEATDAAKKLGFEKTNYKIHGEVVFYDKKSKLYISRDVGSGDGNGAHSGGVWKVATSVENLGAKRTRLFTADADLKRIGD